MYEVNKIVLCNCSEIYSDKLRWNAVVLFRLLTDRDCLGENLYRLCISEYPYCCLFDSKSCESKTTLSLQSTSWTWLRNLEILERDSEGDDFWISSSCVSLLLLYFIYLFVTHAFVNGIQCREIMYILNLRIKLFHIFYV